MRRLVRRLSVKIHPLRYGKSSADDEALPRCRGAAFDAMFYGVVAHTVFRGHDLVVGTG
jgi:hypothetical protein